MDILKIAKRVQNRCKFLSQIAESAGDSEIAVGMDWVNEEIDNITDGDGIGNSLKALMAEISKFVQLKAELRQLITDQADDGEYPYYYCDINGFHNIGKAFALELLTAESWENEFNK